MTDTPTHVLSPGSPMPGSSTPGSSTRGEEPPPPEAPGRSRLPWWAAVLGLYVLARLVTSAVFAVVAHGQHGNKWIQAHPSLLHYATIWDSVWYQRIATSGYPTAIPRDAAGNAVANAWAFLPVYPGMVRAIMQTTGLSFEVAAVGLSLVAGAAAALVFYRLVLKVLGSSRSALFATLLLCINPVALLFQVGYAESLALLLLLSALLLVLERRYALVAPLAVLLAFTRPGEVAFALFLGLHVLYRLWRRRSDPFPARQLVSSIVATAAALVAGLAWPVIAAAVTKTPGAYTETELSWSRPATHTSHLVPFSPWFESGVYHAGAPLGIVVVAVFMAACFAALVLPAVRRIGVDLRLWTVSYLLYVFAVFFPQSSTPRILLPLAPLLAALALPIGRSRALTVAWRIALVVVFLAVQAYWIMRVWHVTAPAVSPP